MNIENNLFDILILLGAIQGGIISSLLFTDKEKSIEKPLLAFLLLLLSLACLNIYLFQTIEGKVSILFEFIRVAIPLIIIMPIGPLIYYYIKALLEPDFTKSSIKKLHFYPVILDFIPYFISLIVFILSFDVQFLESSKPDWDFFIDKYDMYVDIPRWISISFYLWKSKLIIQQHKERFQNEFKSQLKWANHLVYGFLVFQINWLIFLIPYVSGFSYFLLDLVGWYTLYVPLMLLVYWIGINGFFIMKNNKVPRFKSKEIDKELVNKTLEALNKSMEEGRLFLNPDLNLSFLSENTGVQQKLISSVLNQHLGKKFNEYINEYRIADAKKKLIDPKYKHLTITGIAFESGFKSQATFQRAFKQITNQSPKEYRKKMLEN